MKKQHTDEIAPYTQHNTTQHNHHIIIKKITMKKTIYFSVFKLLNAASTLLTIFLQNGKCWLYSLVLICCAVIGSGQLVFGQTNLNNTAMNVIATPTYNKGWITFKPNTNLSPTQLFTQQAAAFNLSANDQMQIKRTTTDDLGFTHYRYQQYYKGVVVEPSQYIVHARNGYAEKANGVLITGLNLQVSPSVLEPTALQFALAHVNATTYSWQDSTATAYLRQIKNDPTATYYPTGQLMITCIQNANPNLLTSYVLAYKFDINSSVPSDAKSVYVNAHTGIIVKEVSLILSCTPQTVNTFYNGVQTINVEEGTGYYINNCLSDNCGTAGGIIRTKLNLQDISITDNSISEDNKKAVNSLHWALERTYDYYHCTHNRRSFDDNNMPINARYSTSAYNQENAYWSNPVLKFGKGIGNCFQLNMPIVSLDVVGHEFTHGVTEFTAGLSYEGEQGALNESFGDIFGTMVEFYVEGNNADYLINEDSWKSAASGNDGYGRSMANPKIKTTELSGELCSADIPSVDTYYPTIGSLDMHYSSGVQNRWFYLLAEGAVGLDDMTNDNGDLIRVCGIGREKAAAIAYLNLTTYLTSTSGYTEARLGSLQAAEDLFGQNSNEYVQTQNAWNAVGVYQGGNMPTIATANYDVINNTTWDNTSLETNRIVVKTNATLIINNSTIIFSGPAAGITVEKGGKLIIDNATLRDNSCAATPWQGITVNGNGFVPHPANYLTTNSPDHGIVVVKNGSVIENAQYGIYTSELNTSALGFTEYTGGGIIDVQSSTLRNNLVGIHIGHFYGYDPNEAGSPPANAQQSKVLNNTFINTAPYLGNPTLPYTHLYLNRSEAVRVDGNTFQTQANTGFTTQTRGTGIVATNTSTTIGSNTLALSNTFINLYKGVDVYNTLTAVSVTNVVRNQFLETDKAITLNSVPYATIENNIIDVKTGTATNDTYGILTTASFGFDILSNFFNSNAPDGNLYTKGIVVQQSYYTNTQQNQAIARNNQFAGKFAASTQIEGDCRNLQTQCNMYYSGSKYDWYIAPNYPYLNGTPAATLLDPQGICLGGNSNLSFATYWHSTATGTYHIKNNAVAPITINYDIDSNPTATSGNVIKNSCSDNLGQPIKNNSCGYFVTVPDVCCTNGAICESGIAVAGRIRYLIKQNDKQGIVSFLTCIDQVWAYRLLVATLIDQRQLTEALSTLLRIPDDSPDNIEFKAICNAVIANLLSTNSSGGRSNQAQLQSLRTMAQTRQSANTLLTESYLAALQGNSYVRTSAPIEADKTEINESTVAQLRVVPNPANNIARIIYYQTIEFPVQVQIFDLKGQLCKQYTIADNQQEISISTNELKTGVYYCRISGINAVGKLIVVH